MMVAKLSFLLILVGLHCCVCTLFYYISTDPISNKTCTTNGNGTLSPCYSLHQLSHDKTALHNLSSITLLLLPRIHVIPKQHILKVSNVSKLVISPWNDGQKVTITCGVKAAIIFKDVRHLEISSINLNSCPSEHFSTHIRIDNIHIINCAFIGNTRNYALRVSRKVSNSSINIQVNNCSFYSNNLVLSVNGNHHNILLTINYTTFSNNWSKDGSSGMIFENSVIKIYETNFINNSAKSGGAMFSSFSNITIDTCRFENNSALSYGGVIYATGQSVLTIYDTLFEKNYATNQDGGAIYSASSTLKIYNSWFCDNSALGSFGGAISSSLNDELILEGVIFQNNFANITGGATNAEGFTQISHCQFINNTAALHGGALSLYSVDIGEKHYTMPFIVNSSFISNTAGLNGGGVYCEKSTIAFEESYSKSNSAMSGGFLYSSAGCTFDISGNVYIDSNSATNGGAIYAEATSTLTLRTFLHSSLTKVTIINNTAREHGGALYLDNSQINVYPEAYNIITFSNNAVTSTAGEGGAIFVLDFKCEPSFLNQECFIVFWDYEAANSKSITFTNNSATYGSVLYGGLLDLCISRDHRIDGLLGIDKFNLNSEYERTALAISSDPVRVCLCVNETQLNCATRGLKLTGMRGQQFRLAAAAVDQDKNFVEATIKAHYMEPSAELDKGEARKEVYSKCRVLSYHIYSVEPSATMILQPESVCENSPNSIITISITVLPCSRGFEPKNDTCICDRRLTQYFSFTVCDVDANTIIRKESIWLRYDEEYLRMHTNCPLDYCRDSSGAVNISSPDEQCANHRSGVICGACQDGHSIALGSSKCLPCTSRYTFIWLTLVFAVAGVALVALLLVCNMTISMGTLNGLIFYANVVSISGLTNLQNCSIHPILSVFIAWLNLDFGVETCFYPGMNSYHKIWLQFVFPIYIFILVVAITLASYYSSMAMKVFGRNNIAILATLFFLSYSKLLKTIIMTLTATEVLISSVDNVTAPVIPHRVWTYDGNIEYLKGKHVALFTVALLLLIFLFLPYTLLLIFGQCVRSMSVRRRWVLWWIRSTAFISIMDAYHAPYNKKHRYWTGLMLLTRCVLFLAFASSSQDNDILANMYITTLVISGVLTVKTFATKIYKNVYIDVLELGFLFHLLILSASLYYIKGSNTSDSIICKSATASLSISLVTFIGIVAYHTYLKTRKTRIYLSIKRKLLRKLPVRFHDNVQLEVEMSKVHKPASNTHKVPSSTLVELREELLASDKEK